MFQDVQELPEYKDQVSLELQIKTNTRTPRDAGYVTLELHCKDMAMMAQARDALQSILKGLSHISTGALRFFLYVEIGSEVDPFFNLCETRVPVFRRVYYRYVGYLPLMSPLCVGLDILAYLSLEPENLTRCYTC
jgi:hypothetical protein